MKIDVSRQYSINWYSQGYRIYQEDVHITVCIALFLVINSTLMIPHKFSKRKDSGLPFGCTDTAAAASDGGRGDRNV
jgi:hypothetical protein